MVRELAFNLISNKIANAVSKCTVNVYENNRRVKNDEWYRWNIQPNRNQSATQFWAKLINHLYENNEALVVVNNEELYVADDYQLNDDSAFFEHYFQHVTVNSFTYSRNLRMSEVFYFKLNSKNLRTYLDGTLSLYAGLINAAYSSYLVANGNKGILKIDSLQSRVMSLKIISNSLSMMILRHSSQMQMLSCLYLRGMNISSWRTKEHSLLQGISKRCLTMSYLLRQMRSMYPQP